jgi:eukaryotic-like serine/threonine-protein kinase
MKQCSVCLREYKEDKTFCPFDGNKLVLLQEGDPHIDSKIDNKYHIIYKIAEGGMGNVYYAIHMQLGDPVAVKIMHASLVSDQTAIERFRREAQAAMRIRHTNAIAIMDFGVSSRSTVYLVMEYLHGYTLRHRLKQGGDLPISEVIRILQQVCAAVNAAHKRKIIHRDLKPENIFMQQESGEETVKVLDFGIAKLKDQSSGSLTRQGMVVGTPHYMSPEQCLGAEVDMRSDVYSLGVIAYEMLAGKLPFEGSSSIALAIKQTSEMPLPICEVKPDIHESISAVVMRALAKSPDERQQSVLDFAGELELAINILSRKQETIAEQPDPDRTERLPEDFAPLLVINGGQQTDESQVDISGLQASRHTIFGEAISTGSGERLDPDTSRSLVSSEIDVSRELIKDRSPIPLPVSNTTTYAVTCQGCGEEVGRSVIPDSTIICPTCRTKMRNSGPLS